MSKTVATRFRSSLPGAGFDSSGAAKQGKRRVVGTISVTSYVAAGESLSAADVGLSTIDFISIKHSDESAGPNGQGGRFVRYQFSTADFYIVQEAGVTGKTDIPTGTTHALRFEAVGDSADDVELT
jgi:hypothetical protein